MSDHLQLVESAFVGFLKNLPTDPWGQDLRSEGVVKIFASENYSEKSGAFIVVSCGTLTEEPLFTRNRTCEITVELFSPVSNDAGQDQDEQLDKHNVNANALHQAMEDSAIEAGLISAESGLYVYKVWDRQVANSQDENGWTSSWTAKVFSIPIDN